MGYRFIEEYKALKLYDEMLDEHQEVDVCGFKYSPSYALKRLDETAYRCGFNDWLDSEELTTDPTEADEEE